MGKLGTCKVCIFFNRVKWEKDNFNKKVVEGSSLRILQAYLEALGCKADLKTISKHLKHLDPSIAQQRNYDTSVKKTLSKSVKKVGRFFIKTPQVHIISKCEHIATRKQFNMATEQIDEFCVSCGKLLGSYPTEKAERQDRNKNLRIYESVMRRRRK